MSETSNQFVDPLLPESLGVVAYGVTILRARFSLAADAA